MNIPTNKRVYIFFEDILLSTLTYFL